MCGFSFQDLAIMFGGGGRKPSKSKGNGEEDVFQVKQATYTYTTVFNIRTLTSAIYLNVQHVDGFMDGNIYVYTWTLCMQECMYIRTVMY